MAEHHMKEIDNSAFSCIIILYYELSFSYYEIKADGKAMIKVLEKSIGVIEMLAIASPDPIRSGEIAETLGINKATCSRILKYLCAIGYAEHISRSNGYRISVRAYVLGQQSVFQQPLIEAGNRECSQSADNLGASVILTVMRARKRYIVCHSDKHNRAKIVLKRVAYTDFFDTVTGAMLLAFASRKDRDICRKQYQDQPGELFQNITTDKSYHQFLDQIRSERFLCFERQIQRTTIFAVPILSGDRCVAALGATLADYAVTTEQQKQVRKELDVCAARITAALNPTISVG